MTSKLDISTTVDDAERQSESNLMALFSSQCTVSDYIDAYWERIVPREGISDTTRTITCIAEEKPTNTFTDMREIRVNAAFQVSKRSPGSINFVPAKVADNVSPVPGVLNAFWEEVKYLANISFL